MKANRSERGQALIIIVLSIVAIFGFAALAVDIGRIYAERRRAQSAADAAALAAAYSAANTQLGEDQKAEILADAKAAAVASAAKNGYSSTQIKVHQPDDGQYEECKCEYIQVDIFSQVDPIFAQFVYKGVEKITTSAVARARRNTNITSDYYAVHAISTDADALEFDNTANMKVTKPKKDDTAARLYSNGGGVKKGGSIVHIFGGNFKTAKPFTCDPDCSSLQSDQKITLDTTGVALPIYDAPMPYCPDKDETYKGVKYYVYPDGMTVSGNLNLQRGVHCIDGGITLNGGSLKGDGVLIVLKSGGITGSGVVELKRMNEIIDKHSHSYNGMLLYAAADNTATITLGGVEGSFLSGTIYAPKAICQIGGGGPKETYNMSIICNKVKFIGDQAINLFYDKLQNFQMQPVVELIK